MEEESTEMDWLGLKVIDVLTMNHGHDYAMSKKHWFEGQNRFGCLLSLNNLDGDNLQHLANNLGIDFQALKITIETCRSL